MLPDIYTICAFGLELEERGIEPIGHTRRLVTLVESIGRMLGLNDDSLEALSQAAYLHDIGKLVIPEKILTKPAKLDFNEWEIVKTHSHWSFTLAKAIPGIREDALKAILHHHERFDGTGYPLNLAGQAIPIEARILTICDVYDTLLSQRSYSRAWGIHSTLEELQRHSGTQFDPQIIEAFLERALGTQTRDWSVWSQSVVPDRQSQGIN
jgi:HD-GYP domain-containing protein (c-di-GMP phosphodiesterase class II)